MSQNPSEKSQDVKAPIVRVGDALVRKGETITGNPARTKYLGGHMSKPKRPVAPQNSAIETTKTKDAKA